MPAPYRNSKIGGAGTCSRRQPVSTPHLRATSTMGRTLGRRFSRQRMHVAGQPEAPPPSMGAIGGKSGSGSFSALFSDLDKSAASAAAEPEVMGAGKAVASTKDGKFRQTHTRIHIYMQSRSPLPFSVLRVQTGRARWSGSSLDSKICSTISTCWARSSRPPARGPQQGLRQVATQTARLWCLRPPQRRLTTPSASGFSMKMPTTTTHH